MTVNQKEKGRKGENIVALHYQSLGYDLVGKNYTIPGGEIDLIVSNQDKIIFVEVKTIDTIDDIDGYVTKSKIGFLERAIEYYLMKSPTDKTILLDVVFVKENIIVEVYENITNS